MFGIYNDIENNNNKTEFAPHLLRKETKQIQNKFFVMMFVRYLVFFFFVLILAMIVISWYNIGHNKESIDFTAML